MNTIEDEIKIADACAKYLHECFLYTVMFVLYIRVSNLKTDTLTSKVIITVEKAKKIEMDRFSLVSIVANDFNLVKSKDTLFE